MERVHNFINEYLLSCDISNLLAGCVLSLVVILAVATSQYMLACKLLNGRAPVRQELAKLADSIAYFFKFLGIGVVLVFVGTVATYILVPLIADYYGYSWGESDLVIIGLITTPIICRIAWWLRKYIPESPSDLE